MTGRIRFRGPARYRIRSMAAVARAVGEVVARRTLKGPRRPGWNWAMEVITGILQRQMQAAFQSGDANEARRFLDSIELRSPALAQVDIAPVSNDSFTGSWYSMRGEAAPVTMLYLHGGGYSFYPLGFYCNLCASICVAARARMFALDYGLTPEHRFHSQLDDARRAYGWLLENGADPSELVVAGDSAGANLTLALLLSLRDAAEPLPALAVALSPATDFTAEREKLSAGQDADWITEEMALRWADWFCAPEERGNPLVSPVYADLRGLPPLYLQAGSAEILYASIRRFADAASRQGAEVVLDTWPEMNHDFQAFGDDVPQSAEAIQRIGSVIQTRLRRPVTAVTAPDYPSQVE